MSITNEKSSKRIRRHNRIRAKVHGTAERPRLAVYRSNSALYAQLIDDVSHTTIAAADSRKAAGATRIEKARSVGAEIATKAKEKGVTAVVFDRGGFLFTGAIKELADGARAGGLTF